MKNPNIIFPQDIFKDVVSKVSADMLPTLQAINSKITGVHFEFGTGVEIIETLQQKSNSTTGKNFDKYPLVAMFLDVKESFGNKPGIYSTIPSLRMAIINGTKAEYKAEQRDQFNFKPILTPILQNMLNVMYVHKALRNPGGLGFKYDATRNYYWGREGLYSKEGNIFNDKLDAIEINFRDLEINSSYCPPVEAV